MKVLELFAGSCSFSNVAKKRGHETFTSDYKDFGGIDYVCDILDFDIDNVPYKPDLIWASPPCTTFSVAGCFYHWTEDGEPKTEEALKGVQYILKTLEIIEKLKPRFYFIENPRGLMRKKDFMRPYDRATVWYCKYGDIRAKPTDIWSNNIANLFNPNGWMPRPRCFNNNKNCHHEAAPRLATVKKAKEKGIKLTTGGTAAMKGNYERSKIPKELCVEIIMSAERVMNEDNSRIFT